MKWLITLLFLLPLGNALAQPPLGDFEDYDQASENYSEFWEQVLAADKEGYRKLMDRAGLLWAEGGDRSQELALRQLRSAISAHPREPEAHYWLGHYQLRAGKWSDCANSLSRAYEIDPAFATTPPHKDGSLRRNLAICLLYKGDFAEAIQHLEQLWALGRGNSTITLRLAEGYMALGRLEDAINLLKQREVARSHRQESNYILSVVLDRAERESESSAALLLAMRRDGNLVSLHRAERFFAPSYDLHYYLGLAYKRQKRFAQAIFQFRRFRQEADKESPWLRRAQHHVQEMLARTFAEKIELSGVAEWPVGQLRSRIREREPELGTCVEGWPLLVVQLRLSKIIGGPATVHAIAEHHHSIPGKQLEDIVSCIETAGRRIVIPKAKGPQGSHVSAQLRWVSRASN